MIGWRGRIGLLIPPGAPTVEGEVPALMPRGVSVHFSRMVAHGETGSLAGQDERNRAQLDHLEQTADLLAMVKPGVMVMAHTASSYTLGKQGEAALRARMSAKYGVPFLTAFSSVIAAFDHLGIRRIALGAPYAEETTLQGKAHMEAHGIEVVRWGRLEGVKNIYDETTERTYQLARRVDGDDADAVFLSGVGLQTMDVLAALERDLRKPVISSVAALTWASLRAIGVHEPVSGYGQLLAS